VAYSVIDPAAGIGKRAGTSGIERDRRKRSEVRGMGTGAIMLTLALAPTLTLALGDETAMHQSEQKAAKCATEARVIEAAKATAGLRRTGQRL
jgi:hypothetical protein